MLNFSHGSFWWHQLLLPTNHFFPPSSSHRDHHCWVDLVSPTALNFGVQHIVTDFGISNNIPLTMMYCTQPVTLEFGLRTIPFGYLCSAEWAQSYSMSLDPLSYQNIYCTVSGKSFFFCFFIHCLTLLFHLQVLIACIWLMIWWWRNKCSLCFRYVDVKPFFPFILMITLTVPGEV